MEYNKENADGQGVEVPINEVFIDKQVKTTFSMRVTQEQKQILSEYQRKFSNQSEFVTEIIDCLELSDDRYLHKQDVFIHLSPYQRALLDYIAKREAVEGVTVEAGDVLMYVFDEMLVNGNKFSIDAIPDSVIRKLRKEFAND